MGLISLCHPDDTKSCGACCGLYNWTDHNRRQVTELVNRRTDIFRSGMSYGKDLLIIKEELQAADSLERLFEVIYNCPFVGFVDQERRQVGCMIHPVHHGGRELRDISLYGAELCHGHECPSHQVLTEVERRLVIDSVDDWYLYGLVITDIDLIKEFTTLVSNRLGEEIRPHLFKNRRVRDAAASFFRLKETWPYRNGQRRFGKYSFSIAEYHIERDVAEGELDIPESPFKKIFISLATRFENESDARRGHGIIEDSITRFVQLYRGAA
ncbi:MAG: hypothetical protein JW885_15245 [Deltaproteobacteria bacterium]|nr:hypothetical protein [Candidatus Zymogenaceae bacterium]